MVDEFAAAVAGEGPAGSGLSRREAIGSGLAIGGGLLIGIGLAEPADAAAVNAGGTTAFNAFIRIATDSRVTLISPVVEMGQGTRTSTAVILAEELDVGLDQLSVEDAPPDQAKYGNPLLILQMTGASSSTRAWYMPLRKAAASARDMLVTAAARRWGVSPNACGVERGRVYHSGSGRSIAYGDLVHEAASVAPPADPLLKDPKDFKLIGRSVHRIDTPDKVSGKAIYGIDVILPGMKYATLAATPVFGGKVASVDDRAARALPGVRQIVVLDDLVAVVADHHWAAKKGLDALVIEWEPGPGASIHQDSIWAALERASSGPAVTVTTRGDAAHAMQDGTIYETTYELPFLAHASMEVMNCTVHATADRCEIWVGTQVPVSAQVGAATALGLKPEQVIINNHLIGGGFGRRLEPDGVIRAARIAAHVKGPVKVVWSREEDIQQDMYRPVYHDRLRAKVEDGRITAWTHRVTGSSIMAHFAPPTFKGGIDIDATDGTTPPYDIPNLLTEYVRAEPFAVPTSFWRGVGPNSSAYSRERFIDLIARKLGTDPLEFRRSMLVRGSRVRNVLEFAVEKAGWHSPINGAGRTGRGIALLDSFGSFLAAVADVDVADDGEVTVKRVVIAADVGTVINPNCLQAQIQGGVIFGLGAVLHGEITIEGGRVQQSNFHDYRVLRIDEIPEIDVHILRSTQPPGGIGEPGTVVVQPAVVNAVFAATGVHLTRMPIRRELIARGAS